MNFTKEQFINFWGADGYRETFDESYINKNIIEKVIKEYFIDINDCLEIGCGDGYWTTKFLLPNVQSLCVIDLLDKPKAFNDTNIKYYKLNDVDYTLSVFEDNKFDVVYSFGVFCHLSNKATQLYLNNIYRVLKPNGFALIMFPNWNRGNHVKNLVNKEQYREIDYQGWFYNDLETTEKQIKEAGFTNFEDVLPTFRDTLARMVK